MTTAEGSGFGMDEIMRRLPHRYPFLLVDRVLECVPGERITSVKNVSANEQFFIGHFPGRPVMPGVLILEALAQTAGILCFVTAGIYPDENVRFYFAGIDKVRFRRPVLPGTSWCSRRRSRVGSARSGSSPRSRRWKARRRAAPS